MSQISITLPNYPKLTPPNHFSMCIPLTRLFTLQTNIRTLPTVKPTRDLRTRLLAASQGMSDSEGRELNHFVDLLERCLTLNPDKRLTPAEALRHPFFTMRVGGGR